MTVVAADVSARITAIVCDVLELDDGDVAGADSMSAIEVVAALEREFDIVIDPEEMPRMVSLYGFKRSCSRPSADRVGSLPRRDDRRGYVGLG